MAKVEDEVLNDFHQSLCHIDFDSYNPRSPEFVNALNIGLMWKILKDMEVPTVKEEDDVQEEIDGAIKYMEMYKETKDPVYKTMAGDELRHAELVLTHEHSLPSKKKEEYKADIVNLSDKLKGMA